MVLDACGMLRADDLLVLTADHGCDVISASTVAASALSWLTDREAPELAGDPFL